MLGVRDCIKCQSNRTTLYDIQPAYITYVCISCGETWAEDRKLPGRVVKGGIDD
jgi:hypothetical protein